MIPDKVLLLMEETGCDQGEAELALEMCGYVVEEAVKAIPRLHKNIVVFKGRLVQPEQNLFGLFLLILNVKTRAVLRTRAVISYNPAVCGVGLEKDWFEFERHLYGCRLWEGSLPTESLELEQAMAGQLRAGAGAALFDAEPASEKSLAGLTDLLKPLLRSTRLEVKLKKDILDLGQFHAIRPHHSAGERRPVIKEVRLAQPDELLVLKVALEPDEAGMTASELRAGDAVEARILDKRDIAKYLAKLFGGHSDQGPQPIPATVEAIEASAGQSVSAGAQPQSLLVRVRFSAGVCGDAEVPAQARLRAARKTAGPSAKSSWWARFFGMQNS